MTRIKRSIALLMATMMFGATYGGGCSLLGGRMETPKAMELVKLAE